MKNDIEKIFEQLRKFRDERQWGQFHNAKDLAIALNVEAGELLELFLWKNSNDVDVQKVKQELADVFNYAFLLADKYDFDICEIILEKMDENAAKYPVHKAKGNAKKYDEL